MHSLGGGDGVPTARVSPRCVDDAALQTHRTNVHDCIEL